MLISTARALRITCSLRRHYPGQVQRVRRPAEQSAIPRLRSPGGPPQGSSKCSLAGDACKTAPRPQRAEAWGVACGFFKSTRSRARGSPAIRRRSCWMRTARATPRCRRSPASSPTPRSRSCRAATRIRPRHPHAILQCPQGGALRRACNDRRPCGVARTRPARNRSARQALRHRHHRSAREAASMARWSADHRVPANGARTGQPAALQDDAARRRGTAPAGDFSARDHARAHRPKGQRAAAWCRWATAAALDMHRAEFRHPGRRSAASSARTDSLYSR